ncbi:hypothetical protein GCM10028803_60410 [Larkinella knui]|uniref:Uncharacterized protein n=1 Tax=Larkinella knui TaxID=2025310 RepID=A0A3P1CAM2_9BACT|nr:hypothetical protein [Larkinella knui]RRB10381.1 hypothetical protein EHT87_29595 [Larkinella knui]
MTPKVQYRYASGTDSSQLMGPGSNPNPAASPAREPRRPDWLMILMVGLFVLTLLIAWLVDIPALLR